MSLENTHDIGNIKIVMLGGSGGATALSDLTDTNISNPASGQVLKYNGLKWANGDIVSGLGIGKKTSVSSNVIITDIDLHREPIAGDRLLIYFDTTVQSPTGLTTYNNGTAVTKNLENVIPLYYNAGWNVAEFKNDGLLYNNVWVRVQNVPVVNYNAGSGISISNNTIVNTRRGALTGAIDSISSGYAHVLMNGARGTFAAGALIVAQSEASGSATNLRIQYGSQASDSQDFRFYDTEGETLSLSISSGDTIIAMIDNTGYRAIVLKVLDIEAQVGTPVRELRKLKIDGVVYDTDGMRTYEASNVANNNITLSVLNAFQFVQKVIAINTGAHSGSSSAWNLVISDGMEVASVALKNADGTVFADDIHENELLFVYVDTAGNVARVLEIHSHDLEVLKDICITEKTVTGNPITLTDALPYAALSLSADIEPIQDLHGQDAPYVGGAGKNKLPMTVNGIKALNTVGTWSGNVYTWNGNTFEILTDSANNVLGIKVGGTNNGTTCRFKLCDEGFIGDGSYYLNGSSTDYSGGQTQLYTQYSASKFAVSYNGADTPFTVSGGYTIGGVYILVDANISFINPIIYRPMIRLATESDATFAPYSNICPISGHTSVTITRTDAESQTADFTISLGQTVYGGSVDLVTGAAQITHAIATYTASSGFAKFDDVAAGTRYVLYTPVSPLAKVTSNQYADIIANAYKGVADMPTNLGEIALRASASPQWLMVVSDKATIEAFNADLTANNLVICYPLATPIELTLTPVAVEMLKGYNQISSDGGGDITLTYKADRLAAIEAALAALQ